MATTSALTNASEAAGSSSEALAAANATLDDDVIEVLDGGRIFGIVLLTVTYLAMMVAVIKQRCSGCRRGGQRARLMDKQDDHNPPRLERTNTTEIEAAIAACSHVELDAASRGRPRQHDLDDPEWAES